MKSACLLILMFGVVRPGAAAEKSQDKPKLHKSLQQFKWLIGEWHAGPEYYSLKADGRHRYPFGLRDVQVQQSERTSGLRISYTYDYGMSMVSHGWNATEEVHAKRADGRYQSDCSGTGIGIATGHEYAGQRRYALTKDKHNSWSGQVVSLWNDPKRKAEWGIKITRTDKDHATIKLIDIGRRKSNMRLEVRLFRRKESENSGEK